jgi:nucleoid-associated protein YgaU
MRSTTMDRLPRHLITLLTLTAALALTACQTTYTHDLAEADPAADELLQLDPGDQVMQPHTADGDPHMVQILPPAQTRPYTVRRNDTLWKIAQNAYGNGQRWKDIVAANEGLDPARLRVGQTILLPE